MRLTDDALVPVPVSDGVGRRNDWACAGGGRAPPPYLEKGGFLWVDDFWGEAAWDAVVARVREGDAAGEYPIEDVPLSDPIFRSMFEVKGVPQVPSIRFWRATGGRHVGARRGVGDRTSARFVTSMAASSR